MSSKERETQPQRQLKRQGPRTNDSEVITVDLDIEAGAEMPRYCGGQIVMARMHSTTARSHSARSHIIEVSEDGRVIKLRYGSTVILDLHKRSDGKYDIAETVGGIIELSPIEATEKP